MVQLSDKIYPLLFAPSHWTVLVGVNKVRGKVTGSLVVGKVETELVIIEGEVIFGEGGK